MQSIAMNAKFDAPNILRLVRTTLGEVNNGEVGTITGGVNIKSHHPGSLCYRREGGVNLKIWELSVITAGMGVGVKLKNHNPKARGILNLIIIRELEVITVGV
jgi:hypothetical protein